LGDNQQENNDISGNLFHSPNQTADRSNNTSGLTVQSKENAGLTIRNNVFAEATGGKIRAVGLYNSGYSFTNNTFISADKSGGDFTGTASGNKYYASDVPSWDKNPAANSTSASASGYTTFCFTIKKITNPTQKCLTYALPPVAML
jgi:hypothetical protein